MGGRRKSVLTDQQYLKIRDATPVEAAVKSEFAAANQLLQNFVRDDTGVGMYVPDELKDAVFCGHLVADLDSIAGAIGGALLYGGRAARASEINSETAWALDYWGYDLEEVPMVDDVLKERGPGAKVCLVDFQQTTQLHEAIPQESIVGIIEHELLGLVEAVLARRDVVVVGLLALDAALDLLPAPARLLEGDGLVLEELAVAVLVLEALRAVGIAADGARHDGLGLAADEAVALAGPELLLVGVGAAP